MLGYTIIKTKDLETLKKGFHSSLDMYIQAKDQEIKDSQVIDMATKYLLKILDCYPHVFKECITQEEVEVMVELNKRT
jgi:hypothetical protein